MARIVLAFSGGLDTSFCAVWLRETLEADIVAVTVDAGGFTPEALQELEARAAELGCVEHRVVDVRPEVYGLVTKLIQGSVLRGGVYPLSVACERTAQAAAVVDVARELGADAIAHGCTGAGNDQIRFDVAIAAMAPEMTIHAPIRELNWSREQERDWLAEHGVSVPDLTVSYSLNEGLFGTSIGGRETHDPWQMPHEDAYTMTLSPTAAKARPEELVLTFQGGLPVALDGEAMDGVSLVAALNERAKPHGVGRGMHTGDTILGLKGRIAFEAPASLVLIAAHRELAKLVQTKWQLHWCEQIGNFFGMLLHEGLYRDPVMRDFEALLESANAMVSGEVRVRLYRGHADVVGVRSPHSLMDQGVGVYGEGAGAWTGAEAAGFAKLHGLATVLAARRDARATTAGSGEASAPTTVSGGITAQSHALPQVAAAVQTEA